MNVANELESENLKSLGFKLANGLEYTVKVGGIVGEKVREMGTLVMRTFKPKDEENCVGVDITFNGVKGALGDEINVDEKEEMKSRVTIPGNELELRSGRKWFANREEFVSRRELNKESKTRELTNDEQAELDKLNQVIRAEEF